MLSSAHRLTDNKDFQNVYRRGRFQSTALLSVNVLPNRVGDTKVGVVASKKVARKAHDRNDLKRKVREIVRLAYPKMQRGLNIVVSLRPGAVGKDYKALEADLTKLLTKLGVLGGNSQENR